MANITTVTRPYARAILSLARDSGDYSKWTAMLGFLSKVAQDPMGSKLLSNLAISSVDKADFICTLAPECLNEHGRNLVKVLARSKRLAILPELFSLYEKMRMQEQGQINLHLTLAQDPTQQELNEFETTYADKITRMITMTEQVEPALIAGGIAQIDNRVVDASISGRLRAMRDLLRN
jgi:F-type H+-transporting ATPase subunit delta